MMVNKSQKHFAIQAIIKYKQKLPNIFQNIQSGLEVAFLLFPVQCFFFLTGKNIDLRLLRFASSRRNN